MRTGIDRRDEWSDRIAGEFFQCPGLQLTVAQAARLWAIGPDHAEAILTSLVDRQVLFRTPGGAFVRRGACPRCG